MGFCTNGDDGYDAFLSYASADNDFHGNWVGNFEKHLKKVVIAGLRRANEVKDAEAEKFSVCRDETTFPESGNLYEVIEEKVRQSQFLFLFLGKGYLKSEYCLAELAIFREKAGTVDGALKRLYVIVLDQDALETLRNGQPDKMPEQRKVLWNKLRELTQKGIRKEDFLQDGKLLPVFESGENVDSTFNEHCTPLIEEFAKKLINHRSTLSPQPRSSSIEPAAGEVVIGAIPERLRSVRDKLVNALNGAKVAVIDQDDIRNPTEKIRERLKCAKVLVQPFDDYEVEFKRGDPDGGHLAVQKALFEECHKDGHPASGASIIWWKPMASELPKPSEAQWEPIDKLDRQFIDSIPEERKRLCSAQELAAELLQRGGKPSVTAQVWVEWEESDRDRIKEAKDIVRKYFDEICRQKQAEHAIHCKAELIFGDADWANLEQQLAEKPDGVVIVYNDKKDRKALKVQEETISNLPEVLMKKMFPGIFYMRKEGWYRPPNWSTVRFTLLDQGLDWNDQELKEFVGDLLDVLLRKYFDARDGSPRKNREA
ncbi:MAG: toll/interleukin-1 receptor domain-containing protein [Candidatus Methylumidiphilus sp.]